MEELIKITESNGKKYVDARELHEFIESQKDFSTWFKDNIEKYGLIENEDYTVLLPPLNDFIRNLGNNGNKQCYLSIDAAERLSKIEGNEKGYQVRRYLIERELSERCSIKSTMKTTPVAEFAKSEVNKEDSLHLFIANQQSKIDEYEYFVFNLYLMLRHPEKDFIFPRGNISFAQPIFDEIEKLQGKK